MNIEIKDRIDKIQNGIVPEGYKKTKVGIIPEDWEVKKLGDIVDGFETGVSVNSDDESIKPNTKDIGILKTSSISNGKFNPLENKKVLEKEIKNVKVNPKENMLIISRMNTPELVGQVAYVEEDYKNLFLPDRLWQTIILDDSLIDTYWLTNILTSDRYRHEIKSIATGTSGSMKNISQNNFLNLILLTPPLPEQQKIADIFSTWDKAIELKGKLIKEKEEQKKGLMQNLLTGEVRLPGFDGEWEEVKLGDVGKFIDGDRGKNYPNKNDIKKEGVIFLSTKNIVENKLYLKNADYISEEKFKLLKKGNLKYKDILITMRGSIGNVALYSKRYKAFINAQLGIIRLDNDLPEFVVSLFLLSSNRNRLMNLSTGSAQSQLTKNIIENFKLNLPPLKEQQAIAEILSTSDKEIELLKELVKELKEQKKGLMQLLLTGIVRV